MNNPFFLFHTKNGDFMKILITGSSSGIGFDTGVRLLRKGHFQNNQHESIPTIN